MPCLAGSKLSQQYSLSPVLTQLQSMLDHLYRLVDDTPPVQQSLRYGNPAFRTWYATMTDMAPGMLQQVGLDMSRLGSRELEQ
jgi:serine/threonine-protein phosphatase 2A activator